MGYGILGTNRDARGNIVLGVCLLYAGVFLLVVLWAQMALFAGRHQER